jgi:hypothetical protein
MRDTITHTEYEEKDKKMHRYNHWNYFPGTWNSWSRPPFFTRNYFLSYRSYSFVALLSKNPFLDKQAHYTLSALIFVDN